MLIHHGTYSAIDFVLVSHPGQVGIGNRGARTEGE
jgi:hypothetical protein